MGKVTIKLWIWMRHNWIQLAIFQGIDGFLMSNYIVGFVHLCFLILSYILWSNVSSATHTNFMLENWWVSPSPSRKVDNSIEIGFIIWQNCYRLRTFSSQNLYFFGVTTSMNISKRTKLKLLVSVDKQISVFNGKHGQWWNFSH